MNPPAPRLHLVIPAYREAARLPAFLATLRAEFTAGAAAGGEDAAELLVVDDASPEAEWRALKESLAPFVAAPTAGLRVWPPLRLSENTRKGGAVLAGWRALRPDCAADDWLGFVDADDAVSAAELRRLWAEARSAKAGAEEAPPPAIFASRLGGPPGWVRRKPWRDLAGSLYAGWVRRVLGLPLQDPQCGAKLVPVAVFDRVVDDLDGHGFCFDAGLAAALHAAGLAWRERSIRWREAPGGSFRPLRHLPGMLWELARIRRRMRARGAQRPPG